MMSFFYIVIVKCIIMLLHNKVCPFQWNGLGVLVYWQVPIYEMRNDGRDNLLGALLIAGQFVIPEVSRDSAFSVVDHM